MDGGFVHCIAFLDLILSLAQMSQIFLHSIHHPQFLELLVYNFCFFEYTHICPCLNPRTHAYVLTGSPQDIKDPWIICPAGGPTAIHMHTHTIAVHRRHSGWQPTSCLGGGIITTLRSPHFSLRASMVSSLWAHISNIQRCLHKPKCLQMPSRVFVVLLFFFVPSLSGGVIGQ